MSQSRNGTAVQMLEVLANAPVRIPPRIGTARGGKPDVLEDALPAYTAEIDCTTEKSKDEKKKSMEILPESLAQCFYVLSMCFLP